MSTALAQGQFVIMMALLTHYIDRFDILIVPGGGTDKVLKSNEEPIALIEEFVEKQQTDPSRERTLMSICTGSLL